MAVLAPLSPPSPAVRISCPETGEWLAGSWRDARLLTPRQRYMLATPADPQCLQLEARMRERTLPRLEQMAGPGRLKRAWRTLLRTLLGIE